MKAFKMKHKYFTKSETFFTENDAPIWLTCEDTIKGSTMDNRWFWKEHVLTLEVGDTIDTDFQIITRLA